MLTKGSTERSIPKPARLPDPERSEREAVRRAQSMVRRLVAEHDLVRMWTLTQAEATTAEQRGEVVRRFQLFVKRLRHRYPRLRWLAVLEWHPQGHGWHIHMVVNRWLPKSVMAETWGHGFVDARLIRPKGECTGRAAARQAASYVAKYLGKGGDDDHPSPAHEKGQQRYLRSEGLDVTEVCGEGEYQALLAWLWEALGDVSWVWWSGAADGWRGPPVLVVRSR